MVAVEVVEVATESEVLGLISSAGPPSLRMALISVIAVTPLSANAMPLATGTVVERRRHHGVPAGSEPRRTSSCHSSAVGSSASSYKTALLGLGRQPPLP